MTTNYHVRRHGEELGSFSLEELRRRRESGEFNGGEYVQREGASDWQPLDLVLEKGYLVTPPPLPQPRPVSKPDKINPYLIAGIILGVLILAAALMFTVARGVREGFTIARQQSRASYLNESAPAAVVAASKPIVWTTNTLTVADFDNRAKAFSTRQWLDGYERRAHRNAAFDAEAKQFIRAWIDTRFGGPDATNDSWLETESDKLANDTNCTDPLLMTVVAKNSLNLFQARRHFETAVDGFPLSRHKAYPQFYATVLYAADLNSAGSRDAFGLQLLRQCFTDGSFTTNDQQEIAEFFADGWGSKFFSRNASAVCKIAHDAGPSYQWLALVLDGEREIAEAWKARGDGYANTVSQSGWEGFRSHLASARSDLTEAWNLETNYPLAPSAMIRVSLGDSGITEMRQWFDRTTVAQIDYPGAWSEMRWGLRPRWYGNEQAMLALGDAAIRTGRFDTDVPHQYLDCVADVESELDLPPGQHIYGRSDIWPNLQRMYDGYIAAPAQRDSLGYWRSTYAVVAYLAGKYDVARAQLAALDWKPAPGNLSGWGRNLSLMPLEVAARTGPLGTKISAAESARDNGDISGAEKKYAALQNAPEADERTREFIRIRLAQLTREQRLRNGQWVGLLPESDNDPDWVFSFGKAHRLPDGALDVESGPKGHMLFSQTLVGTNFEVRGRFEVIHSSNTNFQAGLVMGTPDFDRYNWYGFRIKRHDVEGDVVTFSLGWTPQQVLRHVTLNNVTNSFDFILRNGKVTASVNGGRVMDGVEAPTEINVPDDSFLVGLGAFNDSADTIIRYRDVQVRELR